MTLSHLKDDRFFSTLRAAAQWTSLLPKLELGWSHFRVIWRTCQHFLSRSLIILKWIQRMQITLRRTLFSLFKFYRAFFLMQGRTRHLIISVFFFHHTSTPINRAQIDHRTIDYRKKKIIWLLFIFSLFLSKQSHCRRWHAGYITSLDLPFSAIPSKSRLSL